MNVTFTQHADSAHMETSQVQRHTSLIFHEGLEMGLMNHEGLEMGLMNHEGLGMGPMNHEGLGMGLSCLLHAWPAGKNKHGEMTCRSNTKD